MGGEIVGVWKHAVRKGVLEITVEPFGKLPAVRVRELSEDAKRLASSLGAKPSVVLAA